MEHVHFFSLAMDKSSALPEEYDVPLVIISYLIAVLAGYCGLLVNDFIATKDKNKNIVLLKIIGGTILGIGVWSMHFIGMLALNLDMPIKYDLTTTIVSTLPAILAAITIIHFLGFRSPKLGQISLYGLLLAIGIAAMHFIGMAAMSLNAVMIHNPITFVFAVLISWVMATVTLLIQFRKITVINRLNLVSSNAFSAVAFGFSVATMHYIAMQSAYFYPADSKVELMGVNIDFLEKAVLSGVVFLMITLAFTLYFKNKIHLLKEQAKNKDIQILDTVENMKEPFVFTNENGQVLMANNSFKNTFKNIAPLIEQLSSINIILKSFMDEYVKGTSASIEAMSTDTFEVTLRTTDDKVWLFRKSKSSSNNFIYTWIDITAELKKHDELIEAKDLAIKSLEELHKTQDELAESKRLASIGRLVNDVAHELNTPIGVSITSLSCLKEHTDSLIKQFGEGKLTKRLLNSYFNSVDECEKLAAKNLSKASKIIERFKLISMEHDDNDIVDVNLTDFFGSLSHCLKNEINDVDVTVKYEISGDIHVKTNEHLLWQIIRLLFENSVVHGFGNKEKGEVVVYAKRQSDKALIAFKDSGSGIDSELVDVLFEPFTSTKKLEGYAGLGLHIAHNIVHQQLSGLLLLKQTNSKGSLFHIILPIS